MRRGFGDRCAREGASLPSLSALEAGSSFVSHSFVSARSPPASALVKCSPRTSHLRYRQPRCCELAHFLSAFPAPIILGVVFTNSKVLPSCESAQYKSSGPSPRESSHVEVNAQSFGLAVGSTTS